MAKKPGLMNDPKHIGGGKGMLGVANLMAQAAHMKAQTKGKSYVDGESSDGDMEDNGPAEDSQPGANPGANGAKHPSAPKSVASKYDGEQHDELSGGAVSPSAKKSKKQVAAIRYKNGQNES